MSEEAPVSPAGTAPNASTDDVKEQRNLYKFEDVLSLENPRDAVDIAIKRMRAGADANEAISALLTLHSTTLETASQELTKNTRKLRPATVKTDPTGASMVGPQFHKLWIALADSLDALAENHTQLAVNIQTKVEKDIKSFVHTDPFWCRLKDYEATLIKYGKDYEDKNLKLSRLISKVGADKKKILEAQRARDDARKGWAQNATKIFRKMQDMDEARLRMIRKLLLDYHAMHSASLATAITNIDTYLKPKIENLDPEVDVSLFCEGNRVRPSPAFNTELAESFDAIDKSTAAKIVVNEAAATEEGTGGIFRTVTKSLKASLSGSKEPPRSNTENKASEELDESELKHEDSVKSKSKSKRLSMIPKGLFSGGDKSKATDQAVGQTEEKPAVVAAVAPVETKKEEEKPAVDAEGFSIRPEGAEKAPWDDKGLNLDDDEFSDENKDKPSKIVVNIKPKEVSNLNDSPTSASDFVDANKIADILTKAMGSSQIITRGRESSATTSPTSAMFVSPQSVSRSPIREVSRDTITVKIEEKVNAALKGEEVDMVLFAGEVFITLPANIIATAKKATTMPIDIKLRLEPGNHQAPQEMIFSHIALSEADKFGDSVHILRANHRETVVTIDVTLFLKWITMKKDMVPEKRFSLFSYQASPRRKKASVSAKLPKGIVNSGVIPLLINPVWKTTEGGDFNFMVILRKHMGYASDYLQFFNDKEIKIQTVQCVLAIEGTGELKNIKLKPETGSWNADNKQLLWSFKQSDYLPVNQDNEQKLLCKADSGSVKTNPAIVIVNWTVDDATVSNVQVQAAMIKNGIEVPQPIFVRESVSSGKYGALA